MSESPYRLLETREVYCNPWIRVREDQVARPGTSPSAFGVIEMKPGSTTLAIDSAGRVCLVSEFKYAIGRNSLELISGGIEPGESPLDAARREVWEEAGLEGGDWLACGVLDPFTTLISSRNYMFLARNLRECASSPDPGEQITVERVPFEEALRMAMDGRITHGASCALIFKAALLMGVCYNRNGS